MNEVQKSTVQSWHNEAKKHADEAERLTHAGYTAEAEKASKRSRKASAMASRLTKLWRSYE
jgi:hypothetical protein